MTTLSASAVDTSACTLEAACAASEALLNKQQVVARLRQYREHYTAEISRQLERISDITRALEYQTKAMGEGQGQGQGRAVAVLLGSLNNAQALLREALLARDRLDMEIGSWATTTTTTY
ncbi:hypothetical protein FBU59_001501 [Linderina macrospora]|uniref:Uncharacterized protein n=1 Tax=Linderina macrospora TaxID=4868 RepID=A0ACC1JE27_9FUNG|nr:hypothetical protein FBU59_001501 [Linderina macrospora]